MDTRITTRITSNAAEVAGLALLEAERFDQTATQTAVDRYIHAIRRAIWRIEEAGDDCPGYKQIQWMQIVALANEAAARDRLAEAMK